MEILVLGLVLTVFLLVAPARPARTQGLPPPPAIRRHVNIAEIQGLTPRFYSDVVTEMPESEMIPRIQLCPNIEQDKVERLVCEGQELIVIARGQMLLLRRVDNQ